MNKELKEAKKILEAEKSKLYVLSQIKERESSVEEVKATRNAIETVLNYIENSIPKEKVEEKRKELLKLKQRNAKRNFDTVYKDGYFTGGADTLFELLEGK